MFRVGSGTPLDFRFIVPEDTESNKRADYIVSFVAAVARHIRVPGLASLQIDIELNKRVSGLTPPSRNCCSAPCISALSIDTNRQYPSHQIGYLMGKSLLARPSHRLAEVGDVTGRHRLSCQDRMVEPHSLLSPSLNRLVIGDDFALYRGQCFSKLTSSRILLRCDVTIHYK